MVKKQNTTLNCWKVAAALAIVMHHLSAVGATKDYPFHGGYVFTEFFFIVSGFFMTKWLEEGKMKSVTEYANKTFWKIIPYTTIATVILYCMMAFSMGPTAVALRHLMYMPLELVYLSELRLATAQLGQLWYLAAMLFAMPFLCWMHKKDKEIFKIFSYALPILWYGYCATTWGQLGHRGQFIDLIRAFTNLFLGGYAYYISNAISARNFSNSCKPVITAAAWAAIGLSLVLTYKWYWTPWDIYCILLFFVAITLSQTKWFVDIKFGGGRYYLISV